MDAATSQALSLLITAILGTGGVATLVTAVKAWRTRHSTPPTETQAVAQVGADWDALNKYWQAEITRITHSHAAERNEWASEREGYRRTIRRRNRRIDHLENHIWLQLPPPPPKEHEDEGNE